MANRPTYIPCTSGSRPRGPASPTTPQESPEEVLTLVKKKAQHARQFYNSMVLPNGDLPQARRQSSARSDTKRGSSSDKKEQSILSRSVYLQPTVPSPSKYGGVWLKPRPTNSASRSTENNIKLSYTLPHRNDNNHKSSSVRSKSTSGDNISTTFQPSPTSSSRSSAEGIEFLRDFSSSNDPKQNSLSERSSRVKPNVNIKNEHSNVISRPESPRMQSHLYQTVSKQTKSSYPNGSSNLEGMSFALSSSKSKTEESVNKPTEGKYIEKKYKAHMLHRQRSNSDARPSTRNTNLLSTSYDSFADTTNFETSIRNYGSASSLDKVVLSHENGYSDQPTYQKTFSHQPSSSLPSSTKHQIKKHYSDSKKISPVNSAGSSPKSQRRRKDKLRSKSDVPDHSVLLDRITHLDGNEVDSTTQVEQSFEEEHRRRHNFAHYDWQSMLFSFRDVLKAAETLKRKNTTTGASKAAALAASSDSLGSKTSSVGGSNEDISFEQEDYLDESKSNDMVECCPFFANEVGGEIDRQLTISGYGLNSNSNFASVSVQVGSDKEATSTNAWNMLTNHSYLAIVERGNTDSLLPPGSPPSGSVRFGIEQVDGGATYYRTYFYDKDHQNLCGIDEKYGPLVISLRREKVEETSTGTSSAVYQYRVIIRTCELCTLRGSILEDAVFPSSTKPSKGFHAKEVLEYICPEINLSCLKVAMAIPKVHDQIMKVDEHNVHSTYKIGVLYCGPGQITEEDMYNNEHASPAFNQFLELLGEKVKLNGFSRFRGGLDVKTDSTGVESVYTEFQGNKIMFHVSTMLPFTSNNRQQLLRKRHIGNDIVTIIFQEHGSQPFNPKFIRSHFQHVFIIIRAYQPCTKDTCYRIAVTRAKNIPRFGPHIPEDSMFPKSSIFREFLLTKIINGENTAHSAGKFKSMAVNTRQEYLRDLATSNLTPSGLEVNPKFPRFFASRRTRENKEKQKSRPMPELLSRGALTWQLTVDDYSSLSSGHAKNQVGCILGLSDCVLTIVEISSRQLIFSIPCRAILGWTVPLPTPDQIRGSKRDLYIYYGRGERISLHTEDIDARDEIIIRLEKFTKGCETVYRQLRRNAAGDLGFHVNYEGIIMEVEPNGYAAKDGIRQSSRLVEICKVAVATMSHEEIIDLLRNTQHVKVVAIPPNEDGTPRKCSMELYHLYPLLDIRKVPSPLRHNPLNTKKIVQTKFGDCVEATNYTQIKQSKIKAATTIDTKTTLVATATRLAVLNQTQSYKHQKSDNNSLSSTTNTMSSNMSSRSGADVDWGDSLKFNQAALTQDHNAISSDSGLNSNNNSSYSSTLNRTPTITPTSNNMTHDLMYDGLSDSRRQNQNSKKAEAFLSRSSPLCTKKGRSGPIKANWNPKFSRLPTGLDPKSLQHSYSVDCTESCEVNRSLKVYVAGTENHLKSRMNCSLNPTPSLAEHEEHKSNGRNIHYQSQSYDSVLSTPLKWRTRIAVAASNPKTKRRASDMHLATSRLKSSSPDVVSNGSDVQSSLIRLITAENPPKPVKSPSRLLRQRSSPKRIRPLQHGRIEPPTRSLYRTVSDESLCGARNTSTSTGKAHPLHHSIDGRLKPTSKLKHQLELRDESKQSDTYDSHHASPMLPLPDTTDWNTILCAAKAAEVFEASSMKSVSMGTLNELGCADDGNKSLLHADNRTMSVEYLYEHEYRRSQGDPVNLLRTRDPTNTSNHSSSSQNPVIASAVSRNVKSASEQRLERIEYEMRLLQDKLRQEQERKNALEDEVAILRRDNTRLQNHACVRSVVGKVKSSQSN